MLESGGFVQSSYVSCMGRGIYSLHSRLLINQGKIHSGRADYPVNPERLELIAIRLI